MSLTTALGSCLLEQQHDLIERTPYATSFREALPDVIRSEDEGGTVQRNFIMGDVNAVATIRSAVAAMNAGDIDGYLGHFDASSTRRAAGLEQPLTLTDIGDSLKLMSAAFDGLHLDEDLLFGDERFVCARWRLRGVQVSEFLGFPPTGKSIDIETCEIYEVDRGKVVSGWVYGDVLEQFARQLGPAEATGL
jgi:predicted ester cyclase